MKNIFLVFISLLIFISCSKKDNQREKIEEEKEKLRIEAKAKEEFLNEEKEKAVNEEIEILALRLENLHIGLSDANTKIEKLEIVAQIEALSHRILNTDYSFIWLESSPKWEYKKLKTFEIEFSTNEINRDFNPKEETEDMVKAKIYLEAKKIGGIGVVNLRSDNGKLSGDIISSDL